MTNRMSSRERVLAAFAHQEPDHVPAWLGAAPETRAMMVEHLGLADDEALSVYLGDDFRRVYASYAGPEEFGPMVNLMPGSTYRTPFGVERYGYGYGMMGGRGGMMWDGDEPGGYGWGMMGGAYQDEMHAAIADALGMTEEELEQAMWEEGKTPWQLADEKGISQDELWAAMQDAHASVLAEMVADGVITQEQADWMQQHMSEGPYGPGGHCPGWQDDAPDAGTGA